ncbi:MAG TPA: hypothetical protein VF049_00120 [Nocardioidaceae bacterium]
MALELPAGVFLTGRDCALIDRALREGLAVLARRDGLAPAGVGEVAAAVRAEAARFRNQQQRRSDSGCATGGDVVDLFGAQSEAIELTTTEVARRYGCSASYARRLAARGAVVARRTSSGWLVDASSAAAWADQRSHIAA